MNHYILTRSSFAPTVSLEENRLRLELLRRVTVPTMAAQTMRDLTWMVLVNPDDPLLPERRAAIESAGLATIVATSGAMAVRGWADAPWGPWGEHIDWSRAVLTFRHDDDDALHPRAMEWLRVYAEDWERHEGRRSVIALPVGYRIWQSMSEAVWLRRPMASALYVPPDDRATICDVSHLAIDKLARPIRYATQQPAWLWIRHEMTRSTYNTSMRDKGRPQRPRPVSDALRAAFPVDWDYIAALPAPARNDHRVVA